MGRERVSTVVIRKLSKGRVRWGMEIPNFGMEA